VTATIACHASPSKTCSPPAQTVQCSGCSVDRGVQSADRVGERAEEGLERLGAAGGGGGEPCAGDVDERAPVGEAPELHRRSSPPVAASAQASSVSSGSSEARA
jgi:hypothetical protein